MAGVRRTRTQPLTVRPLRNVVNRHAGPHRLRQTGSLQPTHSVGEPVLALFAVLPLLQATVELAPAAVFPKLNTESTARLTASLTDLLRHAENPTLGSNRVAASNQPTTAPLLKELKGLCARGDNTTFFVPYLSSVVANEPELRLQLTYAGVLDGKPLVRAIVELIARDGEHGYTFAAPLARNTSTWSRTQHGRHTLLFATPPDAERVTAYFAKLDEYDTRLGNTACPGSFYCTASFAEAQRLIGLSYRSDYAARTTGALSGRTPEHYVFVDACYLSPAAELFDPHDLWHDRLRLNVPAEDIHRPVDEGAAYLYGGSWGLTWPAILADFQDYAAKHPAADWLALYEANFNFTPRSRFPLHVDYAINALLIEQLEAKHGFAAVRKLLTCGPKVAGNGNYFERLEQVTGITRETFAEHVRQLLKTQ